MERFYQTEWQGIRFSEIAELSETEPASAGFYNAFYNALFQRYTDYEALDPRWREGKRKLADWIVKDAKPDAKILSVGCGLGYMENYLHQKYAATYQVHVSEFALNALKWLREKLPEERVHLDEVTVGRSAPYDLIYFSAVDYAMKTADIINMLKQHRALLSDAGTCIMISASFLSLTERVKNTIKKMGLYRTVIQENRQFWGWKRTRKEYNHIMKAAGFVCTDGFVEVNGEQVYFIKGTKQ